MYYLFSPEGILNRHESEGDVKDTLRNDLAKATDLNISAIEKCFKFNKQIDIKVLSDLQIKTLGWTNIEEAIKTGISHRGKTIAITSCYYHAQLSFLFSIQYKWKHNT